MIMRTTHRRSIGVLVDVLILLAAVTLVVRWPREPSQSTTSADLSFRIGQTVSIDGVNWQGAERTVVLALNTECPACNSSVDFYKRLFRACAGSLGCHSEALSLEPKERVLKWFQLKGISSIDVNEVSKSVRLGISTTPTLAILDSNGTITDLAVGLVALEEEERFLARVIGQPGVAPIDGQRQPTPIASKSELASALSKSQAHLLDLREHEACFDIDSHQATCLPLKEIGRRASQQFSTNSTMIINCSRISSAVCHEAADQLFRVGFGDVLAAVADDSAPSRKGQ